MKKIILSAVAAMALMLPVQAQDCTVPVGITLDKSFDKVPQSAQAYFQNIFKRAITQDGISSESPLAPFQINVSVDPLNTDVVAGPPTQISYSLGLTLYMTDMTNEKKLTSGYFEIQGVGKNETQAYKDAFKHITAQNAKLVSFVNDSKTKALNYYNKEYPVLIKEAQNLAKVQQYEAALAKIYSIPSCCKGYDQCMNACMNIYTQYRDIYAKKQLAKARAIWSAGQDANAANQAAAILASIDPESSSFNDAITLLAEIKKQVRSDLDFEIRKKYEDAIELKKLRIQAIRDIGIAYGTHQPNVNVIATPTVVGATPSAIGITQPVSAINGQVGVQEAITTASKMTGADIFKKYNTAVFTIQIPIDGGYCQGSGFFINQNGLGVSNYHVFEGCDFTKANLYLPGSNTAYQVKNIVKSSKEEDYIVFQTNITDNNYLPISQNKPNVGDKVYAIGSPKGFTNTFSSGEVSQWRGTNLIQTTVMIDHGSSGGALIDEYGNVIGITSGTFDSESVANLNYARSIDVIK